MPWIELIAGRVLFPLSTSDWHKLSQFYPISTAHPPARLTPPDDSIEEDSGMDIHRFHLDAPEVCEACYEKLRQRRCDREECRIFIRQVAGPEAVSALDTSTDLAIGEQVDVKDASALRRSSRKRISREDAVVRVSSAAKLLDLRVKLIDVVNAAPSDQHILFKGVELTDNAKTLFQLGIGAESRLFVWIDAPNSEVVAEASKVLGSSPSIGGTVNPPCNADGQSGGGTSARQVEIGFKGTRLIDSWSSEELNTSLSEPS